MPSVARAATTQLIALIVLCVSTASCFAERPCHLALEEGTDCQSKKLVDRQNSKDAVPADWVVRSENEASAKGEKPPESVRGKRRGATSPEPD